MPVATPERLGWKDCKRLNELGNPNSRICCRRHRAADINATSQADLVATVPLIVIRRHGATPISNWAPITPFKSTSELGALR